jgi:hypothetical protein
MICRTRLAVPETDKISIGNITELQDILSLKNPKYPQKYPHSKNILLDVVGRSESQKKMGVIGWNFGLLNGCKWV